MAVSLKVLTESQIPLEHRREGLDVLFAVTDQDGVVRYLESDVEAAQLIVALSGEKRDTPAD